jgi:hypothetical protein
MKKSLIIVLVLIAGYHSMYAQPNITQGVFVKDTKCKNINWGSHAYIPYGNKIYGVGTIEYGPNTYNDATLIICNSNFDTIKTVKYGGSSEDVLNWIDILPNGNLLLSGRTLSKNGDLLNITHLYASYEAWLMEVDTNGLIIKARTLSGSGGTTCSKPLISSDGYIYLGGHTYAKDYDFVHVSNYGIWDGDPYYCKLDTGFTIKWMKIFTTSMDDGVFGITEINPNKFIVNFVADDTIPELLGADKKGERDIVIFCIDSNNNVYWKHRYGGAGVNIISAIFYDSLIAKLVCTGVTTSSAGDIGYHTSQKYNGGFPVTNANAWVMILDTSGTIIASKAYGSVNEDFVQYPVYGYHNHQVWVNGIYKYANGDFANNIAPVNDTTTDLWIGVIDTNANLVGKTVFKVDEGFMLGLNLGIGIGFFSSFQNNLFYHSALFYNKHTSISCDTNKEFVFVLNLADAPLYAESFQKTTNLFALYPNPTQNELQIKLLQPYSNTKFDAIIFDSNGKQIYQSIVSESTTIPSANWAAGKYIITLKNKTVQQSLSFIKQ